MPDHPTPGGLLLAELHDTAASLVEHWPAADADPVDGPVVRRCAATLIALLAALLCGDVPRGVELVDVIAAAVDQAAEIADGADAVTGPDDRGDHDRCVPRWVLLVTAAVAAVAIWQAVEAQEARADARQCEAREWIGDL